MLFLQVTQQVYRLYKQREDLTKLYDNSRVLQFLGLFVCNYIFAYYGMFFNLFRMDNIW